MNTRRKNACLTLGSGSSLFSRALILLCVLPFSTGCSINGYGLQFSEVVHADQAWVTRTHAFGLHLRTRSEDGGATFGYSRRNYIFPAEPNTGLTEGLFLFRTPLPEQPAGLVHSQTYGLEYRQVGTSIFGVLMGFAERTLIPPIPADSNQFVRVEYRPSLPDTTIYQRCGGSDLC